MDFGMYEYHVYEPKEGMYDGFMDRFPILFKEKDMYSTQTCLANGIECPYGWYRLLEETCTYLEMLNYEYIKYGLQVVAEQVKEKMGTLCFYYRIDKSDDSCETIDPPTFCKVVEDCFKLKVRKIIDHAYRVSETICADCGTRLDEDNVRTTKPWINYVCKKCFDNRMENKKKFAESVEQKQHKKDKDDENGKK